MHVLNKGTTMHILIHAFYRLRSLILARNIGMEPSFRNCRQMNTAVVNWEAFKVIEFFGGLTPPDPLL